VLRVTLEALGRNVRALWRGWSCGVLLLMFAFAARGADLEEAQNLFLSGSYSQSVTAATEGLADRPYSEDWQVLLTQSLLALGRNAEAHTLITNLLSRREPSLRICWQARAVFLSNGRKQDADQMVDRIISAAINGRIGDAASLVALGRAALIKHGDPKLVLDRMFSVAKRADPNSREVYLAIGELALTKHDFALAAKTFQEGLTKLPDDPDLLHGLALAYQPSEQALMVQTLEAALKRNSNHVASLLLLADHAIDAEAYPKASELLNRINQINPWQPEAWSYRAVIATLQNKPQEATTARTTALKFWATNPDVPHLIGLKLSQKYRFAEGATLQREALQFDPEYLPAKAQLAQDLLRLGEETEGWLMADEVHKIDGYNITANNLMSLHDAMQGFQLLTNEHFQLRMAPHEATLYGGRALELLTQAREKLAAKYECVLPKPTLVEVFTNQADFAVRTFGLPQNDGFLGVCFGNVITANSPGAYPGHPFNWETMLWHEFCHVITLNLTHNKMPRWLSEGISVYEERQVNPAWGEQLTPKYREMILGGELTPISELSAAFLMPPTGEHLQFAYYESSLVVQFIIERFGFPKLLAILRDLGTGAEINQTIAKHTVTMGTLEKDFTAYARKVAEAMGPKLDWERPGLGGGDLIGRGRGERLTPSPTQQVARVDLSDFNWESWLKAHPTNFYALSGRARELAAEKKWSEAKPLLQQLVELCPEFVGAGSAYTMLAEAHRVLGETNQELKVLERFTERDDSTIHAYLRLMELAREAKDWNAVLLNARRYRAVNPLVPIPYRFLADAAEKTGDTRTAIEACRALLQLNPPDPAEANYRLARLLHGVGDPAARQHVLQALEEAPRYREALRLLLEMSKQETASAASGTPALNKP
jgi:tetratricopeptide (TPR) repeat protein